MKLIKVLIIGLVLSSCNTDGYRKYSKQLILTENTTFNKDYDNVIMDVVGSNLVIDMNGYSLNGNCNDLRCTGLSVFGDNNIIKNGTITGYRAGAVIRESDNVSFINMNVSSNITHGIYVVRKVENFKCLNCKVIDNGTMGFYLDAESKYTLIENSEVSSNGYRNKDTGYLNENIKQSFKDKREGIAVDASSYNVFNNITFKNNALSAISIYTNCGENMTPRKSKSNNNKVINSRFINNDVLIASRQDKDLSTWKCFSGYRKHDNLPINTYSEDHAEFNDVSYNTFKNSKLIIKDDNNVYSNNKGDYGPIKFSSVLNKIGESVK